MPAKRKSLDAKERRFRDEYLIDLDTRRAALEAGYSATTAKSKAYQWVSNRKIKPHLFDAIAEAQADRAERTKIDADWVLTRLAAEADADVADLYDENMGLKPVHEWPEVWRKGLVAGLDVEELRVDGEAVGQVRKLKLSDRIKRIELIGKHVNVQAFREQHGHSGPNGGPIETEEVTARDKIASRLARLAPAGGSGADTGGTD